MIKVVAVVFSYKRSNRIIYTIQKTLTIYKFLYVSKSSLHNPKNTLNHQKKKKKKRHSLITIKITALHLIVSNYIPPSGVAHI